MFTFYFQLERQTRTDVYYVHFLHSDKDIHTYR